MPLIFNIMCLVDNKRFRFTFKRIPVYKVVLFNKTISKLLSPFQLTEIKQKMCGGFLFPEYNSIAEQFEFADGFIHACATRSDAQILAFKLLRAHNHDPYNLVEIIEGYIPPFTRYAIDVNGNCICARRMILNI